MRRLDVIPYFIILRVHPLRRVYLTENPARIEFSIYIDDIEPRCLLNWREEAGAGRDGGRLDGAAVASTPIFANELGDWL